MPDGEVLLTSRRVDIASGVPVVVLGDDLLPGAGPFPVTLEGPGSRCRAWAWRASSAGVPLGAGEVGISRRVAALLDLDGAAGAPLRIGIPVLGVYEVRSAVADDLPSMDEVHVPAGEVASHRLLSHNGVAVWVRAVPRPHVAHDTVRMGYQLRVLLGATSGGAAPITLAELASDEDLTRRSDPAGGPRSLVARARLLGARLGAWLDQRLEAGLRALFRAPELHARVTQAHAGDDTAATVTLHPAAFDRLGAVPGSQVLVRWGGREIVAAAVADHDPHAGDGPAEIARQSQRVDRFSPALPVDMPGHLVVRLSAPARNALGCPAATVIAVRRRLRPMLVGNLNQLVIPLAGVILAAAALEQPNWYLIGSGTFVMSVFALAGLRIPRPPVAARRASWRRP